MNEVAIKVDGLSKRYRIGVKDDAPETLLGSIWQAATRPAKNLRKLIGLSRFRDSDMASEDIVWALKGVSFQVNKGEVVGVIGRNGAGKSTLLKILSRITVPTDGRASIQGRISSLLEVGTGFHPELTGRENVYLNGTVLGMTRREIQKRFDEIVSFSEIEKFIDTPVKRYSSGMQVRLAFAVAAHLEPEILLVDEVLAVGDAGFQRKCLGKMSEVGQEGRTVLFVSHNMAALTNLCDRAILIDSGGVIADGSAPEVVQEYLNSFETTRSIPLDDRSDRFDGTRLRITNVSLANGSGETINALRSGESGSIVLHYRSPTGESFQNVFVRIFIESQFGQVLCAFETDSIDSNFKAIGPNGQFSCSIPKVPLSQGTYTLRVYVNSGGNCLDDIHNAGEIMVEDGDYYGFGKNPKLGTVRIEHTWDYSSKDPA